MLTYEETPCVCLECDGLISLESLEIPENHRMELIAWHREFNAVHTLLYESGVYLTWARQELHDITSPINESGIILSAGLAEAFPVYYAFDPDNEPPPVNCPRCSGEIEPLPGYETAGPVCKACGIIFPPPDESV
jgi:hypothetical protein